MTLNGKDFIALRRLSDADDRTIADVGETCERVPAPKSGGTPSDALALLLASGKIAPVPTAAEPAKKTRRRTGADETDGA